MRHTDQHDTRHASSTFHKWLWQLVLTLEREALASSKLKHLSWKSVALFIALLALALALAMAAYLNYFRWLAPVSAGWSKVILGVLLVAVGFTVWDRIKVFAVRRSPQAQREIQALVAYTWAVLIEAGLLRAILFDENMTDFPELAYGQLGPPVIEVAYGLTGTLPAKPSNKSFRTFISSLIQYYELCCRRFNYSAYPQAGEGSIGSIAQIGSPRGYLFLAVATVLYQELYDPQFTPFQHRQAAPPQPDPF